MTQVVDATIMPRSEDSEGRAPGRRMAADALNDILGTFASQGRVGRFVLSPRGLATGGGLAALAGLISAANEFNNPDPSRSSMQNAAAGAGAGVGTVGGALGGALAGRAVGAALGAPLGPVGAIVGSALGGMVGGEALKGLANVVTGAIEGSPEQKALNQARRQAELALELDKQRAQEMMPVQIAAAQAAQDLRLREQRDAVLNQSLGNLLLQSGNASAAQQLAMTQALLGRGMA